MENKSLLCKMNLHSWYYDSGWFNTVERCRRCHKLKDKEKGEMLEKERTLWDQVPDNFSTTQKIRWIKERLDQDA